MQNVEDHGAPRWAQDEYGQADLGDARRTSRVVQMLERAMEYRAGKVTQVFPDGAERKGAYRLLENDQVQPESLIDAAGCSCARRSAAYPYVLVPVDGSSATLADPIGELGSVGTYASGARGIKVISAIALSPEGEPLGVCHQEQWMRPPKPKRAKPKRATQRRARGKRQAKGKQHERAKRLLSRKKARASQKACANATRPVHEKETQRWIDTIHATKCRFEEHAPATKCWFHLDAEGDAWPILEALGDDRHHVDWFTVHANADRCVKRADGSKGHLREEVAAQPVIGGYEVDVPARGKRKARRAHMELRVAKLTLDVRDQRTDKHHLLPVHVVQAHEVGTTPAGEEPLDWTLLTNHPVDTLEQARLVIDGYEKRWRIEDVHKTWKSGGCGIESSQLHTGAAAMKWSTILFTVAVRVERIKHLARTSSDEPASVELSGHEIRALILLKRKYKKRTETIPDTMPTIAQAARWIADLGGYTGKSSGGPFGSITLGRGLTKVINAAAVLESLDEKPGA
ncbi:MAG: IS4 family transposase [Acetobacteraceae bacterium]|nr:IS4 family transposase [Acetobacteraceae bacterium]